MSKETRLHFQTPYLRVNDRDLNMAFYEGVFGFKLHSEENALAIYGSQDKSQVRFTLEESPAARTRAVQGLKKLNQLVIKVDKAQEIEALLARGQEIEQVYRGAKGYAFSAVSPEGDRVLLHAEDDRTTLVVIDRPDLPVQEGFTSLTDFYVEEIILNTPTPSANQEFYELVFGDDLPLNLTFQAAEGNDLTVAPNITWDLELLEFQTEMDLVGIKARLETAGHEVYLDAKQRHLVVSDPSQIEVWISKW